jgi:hypothetical protein
VLRALGESAARLYHDDERQSHADIEDGCFAVTSMRLTAVTMSAALSTAAVNLRS